MIAQWISVDMRVVIAGAAPYWRNIQSNTGRSSSSYPSTEQMHAGPAIAWHFSDCARFSITYPRAIIDGELVTNGRLKSGDRLHLLEHYLTKNIQTTERHAHVKRKDSRLSESNRK